MTVEAPAVNPWVVRTARYSATAQLFFLLVSLVGFAKSAVSPVLTSMLVLDTVVQAVELLFYVTFVARGGLDNVYRYLDWMITTPLMLVSLLAFVLYDADPTLSLHAMWSLHATRIALVVVLDECMLACGALAERGLAPPRLTVGVGFVPFVTFVALLAQATSTAFGGILVALVTLLWSGYGVAALARPDTRAIAYNLLDIVSKNIYGVVIALYILAS